MRLVLPWTTSVSAIMNSSIPHLDFRKFLQGLVLWRKTASCITSICTTTNITIQIWKNWNQQNARTRASLGQVLTKMKFWNSLASPWHDENNSPALLDAVHYVGPDRPSGNPVPLSDHKSEAIIFLQIKFVLHFIVHENFLDPWKIIFAEKDFSSCVMKPEQHNCSPFHFLRWLERWKCLSVSTYQ